MFLIKANELFSSGEILMTNKPRLIKIEAAAPLFLASTLPFTFSLCSFLAVYLKKGINDLPLVDQKHQFEKQNL